MNEGLVILVTRASYYYCLTRMGWIRRKNGDEWEIASPRTLFRSGRVQPLLDISECAGKLPENHRLGREAKMPEAFHRLQPVRVLHVPPEDYEGWEKHFPKLREYQSKMRAEAA